MKFDEVLHSQHHNTMLNNVHLCFRTQTVESVDGIYTRLSMLHL